MGKEETNVGLIGTGEFSQFLLEAYSGMEGIKIKGLCGNSNKERLDRLSKKYSIPIRSLDYKEFLKEKDLDLVVIASPPFLHARMAIVALENGKSVLCEKPLAISMDEARKIREVLASSDGRLKVDFVLRENPLVKKLKKIMGSGIFGNLQEIEFYNLASDSQLNDSHWFWDKSKSGGIWIEHGVHFFDLFSYLTGKEPEDFSSVAVRNGEREDQVSCSCFYGQALTNFSHSFTKTSELEKTQSILSFDRGEIIIKGWIPIELKMRGAVTRKENELLEELFSDLGEVDSREFEKEIMGRGEKHKVDKRVDIRARLESKEATYREAIKEVMKDLNEEEMKVGFEEAYRALEAAIKAEKNKSVERKI